MGLLHEKNLKKSLSEKELQSNSRQTHISKINLSQIEGYDVGVDVISKITHQDVTKGVGVVGDRSKIFSGKDALELLNSFINSSFVRVKHVIVSENQLEILVIYEELSGV